MLRPGGLGGTQPCLCVHQGRSEHGDADVLPPGMRRKLSLELAGQRAALAETGAWIELLRLYVRVVLSLVVDARRDGTRTLQQSATEEADTRTRSARQTKRSNTLATGPFTAMLKSPARGRWRSDVAASRFLATERSVSAIVQMNSAESDSTCL